MHFRLGGGGGKNFCPQWCRCWFWVLSNVLSIVYKEISFVINQPGYEIINLSVVLKLKEHKSSSTDQIPAELIKVGVEQFTLRSINLLIRSE